MHACKIDISSNGDPMSTVICVHGRPDLILPAKTVMVRLAMDCVPEAQVDLQPHGLNFQNINGHLFTFFGDRRFRLVDESRFNVVAKDGTHDHAFLEPDDSDVDPIKLYSELITDDGIDEAALNLEVVKGWTAEQRRSVKEWCFAVNAPVPDCLKPYHLGN